MPTYEYDTDTIHVLAPDDFKNINFWERCTILGTPGITKLIAVDIRCTVGRIQVSAGWPGLRAPFSMTFDAGDNQSFAWLLDPLDVDAASQVKVTNLAEGEGSSSSAPGAESEFKFVFTGSYESSSSP